MADLPHPAERFVAPSTILHGTPLKEVLNSSLIELIGESFARVRPRFDRKQFERIANAGLDELEFKQRAQHIGRALIEQLPTPFSQACPILLAAMGPELSQTEGNGLAPFFYMPHSFVIAEAGTSDFENGMRACYEITKRLSAEFCIRYFLIQYRDRCLERLAEWVTDPNPHVRRLVSEGTRPRLPWAMRLKDFQQNPHYTLPLLEQLKDDRELYVRRSVANHLGDLLKDHPDVMFDVCQRWADEVSGPSVDLPASVIAARRWLVRHAVRLPAKKGDARAIAVRDTAEPVRKSS